MTELLEGKSAAVKTFVNMQCFHKERTPWLEDEQALALTLFNKSKSNYTFMQKVLKFEIPSVRNIQRWTSETNSGDESSTDQEK